MEQLTIPQLLASPTFWFSAVIVGILVGVIGNFATNGLQKIWAKFSETQRKKNDEQEKAFQLEVQDLVANPSKVTDLKLEAIYSLLSNIVRLMFYLVLTNLAISIPLGVINLAFSAAFSVLAVSIAQSAIKNDNHVRKVLKAYELSKESAPQALAGNSS